MSTFALNEQAISEIVFYLPLKDGAAVVELNAGNTELTARLGTVTAAQCDQGTLVTPLVNRSQRLVVSANGALAHLSNQQVVTTLLALLDALKVDGHVFLLETCYSPRSPLQYAALVEQANANGFGFEVERASLLNSAVQQGNFDVAWWLLRKTAKATEQNLRWSGSSQSADQQFLDAVQYSAKGILKYERIFGIDYVSTGGEKTTRSFCETLHSLTSNKQSTEKKVVKVLDVGCGIGGSAFFMSHEYGAHTLGIDLSVNMISIAYERQRAKRCGNVQFLVADATQIELEEGSFDLIYSRDAILHIGDKLSLFQRFYKWLKPGGELFITDYCATDAEWSTEFSQYVAQRGYHLLSTTKYGELLSQAGFAEVRAENATAAFTEILREELQKFESEKESFLRDFKQTDYDSITEGWTTKLRRCEQGGEHHWGNFHARKL